MGSAHSAGRCNWGRRFVDAPAVVAHRQGHARKAGWTLSNDRIAMRQGLRSQCVNLEPAEQHGMLRRLICAQSPCSSILDPYKTLFLGGNEMGALPLYTKWPTAPT